jgi:hypothetical protein
MRLRIRCRLWAVLLAVALVGGALAHVANTYRRGGFAFQRRYARLANDYATRALRVVPEVEYLRAHVGPGHPCAICRGYEAPVPALLADAERRLREYREKAQWYDFLAGTAYWQTGYAST